jgi:hypothetical protein
VPVNSLKRIAKRRNLRQRLMALKAGVIQDVWFKVVTQVLQLPCEPA